MKINPMILKRSVILGLAGFTLLYLISKQTDQLPLFRSDHGPALSMSARNHIVPGTSWHSANFCPTFIASSDVWIEYNFSHVPTLHNEIIKISFKSRMNEFYSSVRRMFMNNGKLDDKLESEDSSCKDLKHFPEEPCDEECARFQAMMKNWPTDRPKSVIYVLTQVFRLAKLKQSLTLLENNFNNLFRYPIVIFYDDETFDNVTVRKEILAVTEDNNMYFQKVKFTGASTGNEELVSVKYCNKHSMGYRHMCRFHALGIYQQPILTGLEYLWRLDDDSLITHPIKYDVFKYMQSNRIIYGYNGITGDTNECVQGLWEAACTFARNELSKVEFFAKWSRPRIFYNNFEISDFRFWKSCNYRKYIDYIDRLGGIYYLRWGDAPIKTIAVSLFVPESQVHRFSDVGYAHQRYRNVPKQ